MHGVDRAAEGVGAFPRTWLGRRVVRTRVRLQWRRLDAALVAGASPWASPELMFRAAELTSPEERRRVAAALQAVVRCAEQGRSVSEYLKLRERAVLHEREALGELATRLLQEQPVPAAVVADLAWLLWNERSPLYAGGESPDVIGDVTERCLLATL